MMNGIQIKHLYIPIALLLLNILLKIVYLDYGAISGDEPFTIFYAQQDLTDMFGVFKNENNPPLHFIVLHFWVKMFGISPFSTRFLSLLFSSLTVLFIYKLSKKSFNIRVAVIASLIFTFSNYHIFFSHETRVYPLFALLTTTSMYAFLSLIQDKKSKKYFFLLAISNVLIVYSHFFGFFLLAIQGLSILMIKDLRRNMIKTYSLIVVITILFYVPYMEIFFTRFFLSSSGGTWVTPPVIDSLFINLAKYSNAPVNTAIFLIILATSLLLLLFKKIRDTQYSRHHSKIVLIWFLFPYLFIFAVSFVIPMFVDRYLIFISIGYYITLAIAIDYLSSSKWVFYSLSVVVIAMMIFTCDITSGRTTDLKEMVSSIKDSKDDNTAVYICPSWTHYGFAYHYNIEYFKDYKQLERNLNSENIYPIDNVQEISDSLLTQKPRVIYLDGEAKLVDPEGLIYKKLQENYKVVDVNESYEGVIKNDFSKQ